MGSESTTDSIKNEIAVIVKQLDDIIYSAKSDGLSIWRHEQNGALNSDLERELGRTRQPIKPDIANDPYRID